MYYINKASYLIILTLSINLYSQELGELTIYNTDNSSLSSNQINCLEFSEEGWLWIGTPSGLNVLESIDGESWLFFDSNKNALPSNNIRALEWATNVSSPMMFVGTDNGIATKNENSWNLNYGQECNPNNSVINTLFYNNELWAGSTEGLCIEGLGDNNSWLLHNTSTGLYSNNITSIKKNVNTNLIAIGTMNGGLLTYDEVFYNYYSSNSDILDNTINDVAFDQNNNIFVCTPQAGLGVLTENNSWIWFNTNNSDLPTNSLQNIIVDNNNNLWITTLEDGLINYMNNNFYQYKVENSSLPDNIINCLILGPNNNLWLGTKNAGLVKIALPNISMKEFLFENECKIYPTFFTENIYVETLESVKIHIYNNHGKLIYSKLSYSDMHIINTRKYSPGLYLVRIDSKNFRKTYKIIKPNYLVE